MKRIISVIGILLVLPLLYACSSQEPLNTISNELGIDVSNGDEKSNMDNHGGFHGDGTTYIVLSLSLIHILHLHNSPCYQNPNKNNI